MMQDVSMLGRVSRHVEEEHRLQQSRNPLSNHDSWLRFDDPSGGLMVFDHKGRLVKADSSAQRTMAALGFELSREPRLRIEALDTSDAQPLRHSQLPDWLHPEWIEPVIEGNERLGTVVQIPKRARESAPTPAQRGLPAHKLRLAIEFVEAHIEESIDLGRLAAVVHSSPFHFHRQFKRSTGLTPGKYIFQVRIKRAKALLSDSDLPLVEVAAQVGFTDQSHFTTAFRRSTSMTPRTYRNATATV
jgi:AraC-like DNA-binding protein